jgi:thiol-disulfide isomerase/thioredoxin
MFERLERLRENDRRGAEAEWRFDIRKAALLRMRAILTSIAGRELVEREPSHARSLGAFQRLAACEAFSLGSPAATVEATEATQVASFPSLAEELPLLEDLHPSWLGVSFGPVPKAVRAGREIGNGANMLQAVYPGSPADEAGLAAGDIVLGPPNESFESNNQLREWTMVSPRDVPLAIRVLRPGNDPGADQNLVVDLVLRKYPLELPELPGPPQVGEPAPELPTSLEPVVGALPDLQGRSYLLFFWATWCGPCKRAVPEMLAFSESRQLPVLAISDEDAGTVAAFLQKRREPFFESVAVDALRKSFVLYGVSGTPTILLVDPKGVIQHRQVGYNPEKGLQVEGWNW